MDVGTPPPPPFIITPIRQSHPQAFFSAVGRLERLWVNGMEVHKYFWRKIEGCYLKQPIKNKDILFELPSLFPSDQLLTKKPGIEIACTYTQPRSNVSLKLKNVSSPLVKRLGQFFVLIRKISFTNEVET